MSSSGSNTPQTDPIWMLMALLLIIGGLMWFLWHEFRPQLLEVLRYMRFGELWVINLFTGREVPCMRWLRVADPDNFQPTREAMQWAAACFGGNNLQNLSPQQAQAYYSLSGVSIGAVAKRTLPFFSILSIPVFSAMAIYALFYSPLSKFRTIYTLETFIKTQAKMWPVISPIVKFKSAEHSARSPGQIIPDKLPPFAEALSPEEWIAWHRIPVTNGIPDREAARRAFLIQLGPRWQGIANQPPYFLALFAAFSLKGVQRREESDELLGEIAKYWTVDGGFQMPMSLSSKINGMIKDAEIGDPAVAIANQHAYRTTALMGVLRWARSMGGVLAPAQFVWLRAVDRPLWYPLNNLGRRSFHTEGAGAMAHFMAEQSAKKPLPLPRIDTAIVTINQFLADPEKRTISIPPREEPKSAKS